MSEIFWIIWKRINLKLYSKKFLNSVLLCYFFCGWCFKLVYSLHQEVVNPDGHTHYSGPALRGKWEKNMESREIGVNSLKSCNPKILEKPFAQEKFFHPLQFKDKGAKAQTAVVCLNRSQSWSRTRVFRLSKAISLLFFLWLSLPPNLVHLHVTKRKFCQNQSCFYLRVRALTSPAYSFMYLGLGRYFVD